MILTCKESARLLSQQLDKPLGFKAKVALRAHLLICRGCRAMSDRFAFLRRAMAGAASRDDGGL